MPMRLSARTGGDAEPDAEDEADGPPVMLRELVLPKIIKRRRLLALVPGPAD